MPTFQQRHYRVIARLVRADVHGADLFTFGFYRRMAGRYADYFTTDNPRFNRLLFLTACGLCPDAPNTKKRKQVTPNGR